MKKGSVRKRLLPKTAFGKWCIGLCAAYMLIFLVNTFIISVAGALMITCGTLSFFAGLFSIAVKKERSILVFVAVVLGLFAFLFLLGELLFPH